MTKCDHPVRASKWQDLDDAVASLTEPGAVVMVESRCIVCGTHLGKRPISAMHPELLINGHCDLGLNYVRGSVPHTEVNKWHSRAHRALGLDKPK